MAVTRAVMAAAAVVACVLATACARQTETPTETRSGPLLPVDDHCESACPKETVAVTPTTTARPAPSAPPSWGAAPPGAILFHVEGSGVAETISYGAGALATTLRDVQLPWSGTAQTEPGTPSTAVAATVQAQLRNGSTGPVGCRISRDGQELDSASGPGSVLCKTSTLW